MTPAQFDILLKRLIEMGTPKEPWTYRTSNKPQQYVSNESGPIKQNKRGKGKKHCAVKTCELKRSKFSSAVWVLVRPLSSKVVVFLIILVWFLDIPKPQNEYQLLEFYAGVGRIASLAKWCGFSTVAVDIQYGAHRQREGKRRPMDINGNAGLVFLKLLCLGDQCFVVGQYAKGKSCFFTFGSC